MDVQVCGKPCQRVSEAENENSVVCELPEMHSVYSVERLRDTVETMNLMNHEQTEVFASDTALGELVFDGDSSSSFGEVEGCYVGLKVASPDRMVVERIRFMIAEEADPDTLLEGVF